VNKLVSYLKLGYGTHWSLGSGSGSGSGTGSPQMPSGTEAHSTATATTTTLAQRKHTDATGHYLIGLVGDVEETGGSDPDDRFTDNLGNPDANSRTLLRTLTVELESEGRDRPESQITRDLGSHDTELAARHVDAQGRMMGESAGHIFDSQDRNKTKQMRVVVYAIRPFIFTFLFKLRTDSLAWDGLYRTLHYQLAPLRKPLLQSTRYRPEKPQGTSGSGLSAPIFDLVWDPRALTVHSTIPNIPEQTQPLLASASASTTLDAERAVWSRLDALNTHAQILNTYAATHDDLSEAERTAKTSRGWWIVWSRILERRMRPVLAQRSSGDAGDAMGSHGRPRQRGDTDGDADDDDDDDDGGGGEEEEEDDDDNDLTPMQELVVKKEILLVRRAGDHAAGAGIAAGLGVGVRGVGTAYGSGGYWTDGANRLAQGIGVDTRRYIEGLLSLNR
jgi:hypothetical protein